jgi:hypothetical protein
MNLGSRGHKGVGIGRYDWPITANCGKIVLGRFVTMRFHCIAIALKTVNKISRYGPVITANEHPCIPYWP